MIEKMYFHSSKTENCEFAEQHELGLSEEALKEFAYALYKVKLTIDINKETGMVEILEVNGRKLAAE